MMKAKYRMDNLKLEHLSAYLPYELKMIFEGTGRRIITLMGINNQGKYGVTITGGDGAMFLNTCRFKPLLRPLSIQFLTSVFPDANDLEDVLLAIEQDKLLQIRHDLFTELVKNHVDVFYLLNRGLAVEIKEGV